MTAILEVFAIVGLRNNRGGRSADKYFANHQS